MAEIVLKGPASRTAISQATGLTAASVSRITRELIEAGVITEQGDPETTGRPGRRFIGLNVNAAGGYVLGIGLNVFQQAVTLADLQNNRLERRDLSLRNLSQPDVVIEHVIAAAAEMIAKHVRDPNRLFGGGVAITGAVDPVSGIVRASPYFGWHDVNLDLAGRLTSALGVPFHVENLPNGINLAEVRFGQARAARNTLLVHCALGLGGSLYLDGQLVRGHQFSAGHIGNLPMEDAAGAMSTLDDLAGGRGILSAMGETRVGVGSERADEVAARLMAVVEQTNAGDAAATGVMENAGHRLGRALALFAGISHPEMILLSGPLAQADAYVEACNDSLNRYRPDGGGDMKLVTSGLTNQAAARWLAIGEFLVERDLNLDNLKMAGAA